MAENKNSLKSYSTEIKIDTGKSKTFRDTRSTMQSGSKNQPTVKINLMDGGKKVKTSQMSPASSSRLAQDHLTET